MSSADVVPFNDLSRADRVTQDAVDAAIARVLSSGWFVLGPEHDAFEVELAAFAGTAHAIGLANGTDALELTLSAVGVGRGDRVLTVANAGGYTTIATRLLGATTVYCDIDPQTMQATADSVRAALDGLDSPPAAIVVTHLYGAMAPVEEIVALAGERGIPVIEDCAQALGARRGGRRAGSFGIAATTSFYPTKNLGALGDGGAVLTSDAGIAERVRRARQYGWTSKYRIEQDRGRNSRLDELQAAILRAKLPGLDAANARRREIHDRYREATGDARRMVSGSGDDFIGHLAVLSTPDRDRVREALAASGIKTDVHYPIPDHRQPLIAAEQTVSLPATEAAVETIVSLPLFPELTDDEVERVCAALRAL